MLYAAVLDSKKIYKEIKELVCIADGDAKCVLLSTGEALTNEHKKNPFNIIFTDPENTNAISALKDIRNFDENTPIIFLSESDMFSKESYQLNVYDFLTKPVDTRELYKCICKALKKENSKCITVKTSDNDVKLMLSNIICVKKRFFGSIFVLDNGREIYSGEGFSHFERFLLSNNFVYHGRKIMINTLKNKNQEEY